MSTHAKLEFERFISSLAEQQLSTCERFVISTIHQHFDEIFDLGTASSRRIRFLVEKFKDFDEEFDYKLPNVVTAAGKKKSNKLQLSKIEVEKFRGFCSEETITFHDRLTLVYGANGSGKSSLCSALEYKLLGYVTDAEEKRINLEEYVSHSFSNEFVEPELYVIANKKEVPLDSAIPDEAEFSFIDRNRIEKFALISANTDRTQTQLIATLFGLDQFDDFVSNFTTNIDQHLLLTSEHETKLAEEKQRKQRDEEAVRTAEEKEKDIDTQKKTLAEEFKKGLSYSDLKEFILGHEDNEDGEQEEDEEPASGRLAEIESELRKPLKNKVNFIDSSALASRIGEINTVEGECRTLINDLKKSKREVNFKKLYEGVSSLKAFSSENCPACDTPIDSVVTNPFNKAEYGLKTLEEIVRKEDLLKEKLRLLRREFVDLIDSFDVYEQFASDHNQEYPLELLGESDVSETDSQISLVDEVSSCLKELKGKEEAVRKLSTAISSHNIQVSKQVTDRAALQEEKRKLDAIKIKIVELDALGENHVKDVTDAKKKLETYDKELESLSAKAEADKKKISKNEKLKAAYLNVVSELRNYRDNLPLKLADKLNGLTCELYNKINSDDPEFEKLKKVVLPQSSGDCITIVYQDETGSEHDALQVLSTGHLKCLGLSILLARNIHEQNPLLVFDDLINAIDEVHRDGVRTVLLEDERFVDKQIILTSHAEEFIKGIENCLSKDDRSEKVRLLGFQMNEHVRRIDVDHDYETFHYLELAESKLKRNKKRACLQDCRSALEKILYALWKRMSKVYNSEIEVTLKRPNAPVETMNKAQAITKVLKKINRNTQDRYKDITDRLKYLTDLKSDYLPVWNLLNQGVHEVDREEEFEKTTVRKVHEVLCELEKLVVNFNSIGSVSEPVRQEAVGS